MRVRKGVRVDENSEAKTGYDFVVCDIDFGCDWIGNGFQRFQL